MQEWSQPPLDDAFPAPPPKRSVKEKENKGGITWSRYKVTTKTIHCDICIQAVAEKWPVGTKAPNLAVFKRVDKDGEAFYCWEHATDQRAKDGLSAPKR